MRRHRQGDSAALEAALRRAVAGEVEFGAGAKALYASDASNYRHVPVGVVVPRSSEDVVAAVGVCAEHGAPVLPRGGGTSTGGQACGPAVILDCSRHLDAVLDLDAGARLARVQPGAVLDSLQRAAAPHGLRFGPDPSTHDRCTLGG